MEVHLLLLLLPLTKMCFYAPDNESYYIQAQQSNSTHREKSGLQEKLPVPTQQALVFFQSFFPIKPRSAAKKEIYSAGFLLQGTGNGPGSYGGTSPLKVTGK